MRRVIFALSPLPYYASSSSSITSWATEATAPFPPSGPKRERHTHTLEGRKEGRKGEAGEDGMIDDFSNQ